MGSSVFAVNSNVNVGIPGSQQNSSPVGILRNLYEFSLMIGGLIAFGAIVYGGIRYATSAGNPSGQSDARDQITQALLGLFLLVGAYLVLNFINPNLVNLSLPGLDDIEVPQSIRRSNSCVPPCGAGSVCLITNNQPTCTAVPAPPPADCDPLQSYPANRCPANARSCTLNIQTGRTRCI